ncbi:circadian phase modifier [Gracilibacillus boraciitolerans JCM 21714]|uniref:Circadian phase modifier n=1 Tax=Gracilibacillus boraciitolerans JCM 21714 TaxID=1298598 RepID=W4VGE6_9BACI|nr:circadian phase modifier [Gracilibacillus boraciitolerans JCM 21714]
MLEEVLKKVANGELSPEDAQKELATFENLGFAKVDHHRKKRQGFPEVIFGEGKEASHIIDISRAMMKKNDNILVTRINSEKAEAVVQVLPNFNYDHISRTLS